MTILLLVARLVLAGIFATAGVAKLADRAGSREALRNFGLPARLAAPLGTLLPVAELLVAMALVPTIFAWWGALGALALLLLFVLGIAMSLARGRRPDCHCFGQFHSAPVGWATLARNITLAAIAGLVVWQGSDLSDASATDWARQLTTVEAVGLVAAMMLGLLIVLEGWLLLNLLRQQGRMLLRLDALEATVGQARREGLPAPAPPVPTVGLPVGAQAPEFRLAGIHGEILTLQSLCARGKPIMLLFTDPGCGPCLALLPEVATWQHDHSSKLTIVLVNSGSAEANTAQAVEHGLSQVLLQQNQEIAESYHYVGTPSAVLIGPDRQIASPVATGADAIRSLLTHTVDLPTVLTVPSGHTRGNGNGNGNGRHHPVAPSGLPVGEPAPDISLPDLSGKIVPLARFQGHHTLVLFWDPACGFCQRMLPDLKAWEASRPEHSPALIIISTGTVEANKDMGLSSLILLDERSEAKTAFLASGTPMGVLVDPNGRVASPLAAGAPAVLALATEMGRIG